jgi:hypothetical protein
VEAPEVDATVEAPEVEDVVKSTIDPELDDSEPIEE